MLTSILPHFCLQTAWQTDNISCTY